MKNGTHSIASQSCPEESYARRAAWVRLCWVALLPLAGILLGGCQTQYDAFVPAPAMYEDLNLNAAAGQANYSTNCIQEGDVVSINFQYSTNFNTVQQVGLDGTLNLQGAGRVKAAGKTVLALQSELASLYKSQVKDDPVTVKVISPTSVVYVTGAVVHPGRIPLVRPMTLVEAVMEADGYDSSRAKLSDVEVLRIEGGRQRVYHVNLKKVLNGDDDSVFYLKPFDVVQVPAKVFNY